MRNTVVKGFMTNLAIRTSTVTSSPPAPNAATALTDRAPVAVAVAVTVAAAARRRRLLVWSPETVTQRVFAEPMEAGSPCVVVCCVGVWKVAYF